MIWQGNAFQSLAWVHAGVDHGFSGVFPSNRPVELVQLDQCHSARVVVFEEERVLSDALERADGAIARRGICGERVRALSVRTADCVPVLAYGEHYVGVVHAGWRGLGAGILQCAAKLFADRGETSVSWLIGPSAGPDSYEVGEDILVKFCFAPAYRPVGSGKVLLDLATSARLALIEASQSPSRIEAVSVDTMADPRFYSYRREGANTGRNISWVAI